MKLIADESVRANVQAAVQAAEILVSAISAKGKARLLLSAGNSLSPFFKEFVKRKVPWEKVEMFHTDEYVGICCDHPKSTNRYIRKEFLEVVYPGMEHLIMGFLPAEENVENLNAAFEEEPIDLAIVGFQEDALLAWNTNIGNESNKSYTIVTLDPMDITRQTVDGAAKKDRETYNRVITITDKAFMNCEHIIGLGFTDSKVNSLYAAIEQRGENCSVYYNKANNIKE